MGSQSRVKNEMPAATISVDPTVLRRAAGKAVNVLKVVFVVAIRVGMGLFGFCRGAPIRSSKS